MKVRDCIQTMAVTVAAVILLSESCLGLCQVAGWKPSNNALFPLTGHFDNPGPYGGYIAILLAVCVSWAVPRLHSVRAGLFSSTALWITLISTFMGSIVLIGSLSRSAWAGFAIAMASFMFRNGLRRKAVLLISIALLLCIPVFLIKRESAIGRMHIWRIESRVTAKNPWTGVGRGHGLGAYGLEQAVFFKEKERSETVKKVAGSPEYAFNEYLGIGMEHGVPGLLASMLLTCSVIGLLIHNKSPFAYGAIVYAVFAFGSYPLSLWRFRVLGFALIVSAIVSLFYNTKTVYIASASAGAIVLCLVWACFRYDSLKQGNMELSWRNISHFSGDTLYDDAIQEYESLYPELRLNYRFLYDYGHRLFEAGRYQDAITILKEGASLSSDPMFHNIIGRCLEQAGQYDEAEKEFILSHYMVPGRLYPLVLLKEMYERQGLYNESEAIVEEIRKIPINPKNDTMKKLLRRAENHE